MQRVNRASDYILNNLERPLALEVVARAASFSPFHFHRIFRSLLGETLGRFVKRVRLLRDELGIHSPEDLLAACEAGRVSEVAGLGARTEERLLRRARRALDLHDLRGGGEQL